MTRVGYGLAMMMTIVSVIGCDEKLSEFAGPTPNLEPTFSSIQRDIFDSTDSAGRIACTSCHNAQLASLHGNLNLTAGVSHAALVNAPSSGKRGAIRVVPGSPETSYLIQKLEGAPGIVGNRMPDSGPPFLTSGQIAIIRRWIELGAANN